MVNYEIFCDMDGVIVDFENGYKKLTGRDLNGQFFNDSEFWDPINNAGKSFWVNLEWSSDGQYLWDFIKGYEPKLLSAPSRDPDSVVGKHEWVEKELPGVPLLLRYAKYKKDFAGPHNILIDDRLDNIQGWIGSGGIGIHHVNSKDTIDQLKSLGL